MARARNGGDQFFRDKDSHGSSSVSADRNPVAGAYTRTQTSDRVRADRSRPPQDRHRASFPRALRSFRHAHAPSISSFDHGDHGLGYTLEASTAHLVAPRRSDDEIVEIR